MIEDSLHSSFALGLAEACQSVPAKVYPVWRQDAAIVLCGTAIQNLLRQTCSVDFQGLSLVDNPVILTQFLEAHQVKFVLAQFVDMHGTAKTKAVPASHFEDILCPGAGFSGFAVWGLFNAI